MPGPVESLTGTPRLLGRNQRYSGGGTRGNAVPPNRFEGERRPPNKLDVRGNGVAVASPKYLVTTDE